MLTHRIVRRLLSSSFERQMACFSHVEITERCSSCGRRLYYYSDNFIIRVVTSMIVISFLVGNLGMFLSDLFGDTEYSFVDFNIDMILVWGGIVAGIMFLLLLIWTLVGLLTPKIRFKEIVEEHNKATNQSTQQKIVKAYNK